MVTGTVGVGCIWLHCDDRKDRQAVVHAIIWWKNSMHSLTNSTFHGWDCSYVRQTLKSRRCWLLVIRYTLSLLIFPLFPRDLLYFKGAWDFLCGYNKGVSSFFGEDGPCFRTEQIRNYHYFLYSSTIQRHFGHPPETPAERGRIQESGS